MIKQAIIECISTDNKRWQAYIAHLHRVTMHHSISKNNMPKPDCFYFGAWVEQQIIGHIAVKQQPIIVPPSYLLGDAQHPLKNATGDVLQELFVQSFSVEEGRRRFGYGRALQEAALHKARDLGCYQMRSWSSSDRPANYALKISLGFTIQPTLYPMPGSAAISGVYFIKRTESDEALSSDVR